MYFMYYMYYGTLRRTELLSSYEEFWNKFRRRSLHLTSILTYVVISAISQFDYQ